MAPIKVAVLDDYKDHAGPIFGALDANAYEVVYFRDTLLPYNHPDTPQAEKDKLVARLEPFQIISTMRERTPFPAALVERLPNLKLLLTSGTRNLALDLDALRKHGVAVAGASNRGALAALGPDSTTQHFIALVLAAARNVAEDDQSVKTGGWQTALPPIGLAGRVYATVGLGRLGAGTARILHSAFGMRVLAWSPNLTQEKADEQARAAGLPVEVPVPGADAGAASTRKTFQVVSREELFRQADVLGVHTVLSERSRGLITAHDLARLKPEAIFVNTSRGPIVVEKDLLDVLRRGAIRSAAIDVFDIEPLPVDSPWRTTAWGRDGRSRVILTPHMGYGEKDTMESWYRTQVDNIQRWARGEALVDKM